MRRPMSTYRAQGHLKEHYGLWIDGEEVEAASGATQEVREAFEECSRTGGGDNTFDQLQSKMGSGCGSESRHPIVSRC